MKKENLTKKILKLSTASVLGLTLLTACDTNVNRYEGATNQTPSTQKYSTQKRNSNDDSSGLGMSYTGKPGIELAPGIVIDYSGNIGPGIGF